MSPALKKNDAKPHQREAVQKILAAFKTEGRTQCIMACGTGKTLVSLRVAEQGKFKTIVVFVPSLALVSQVLKEYRIWTSWKKWSAIAVCSDETVAHDYNKIAPEDVGCAVVNDPKAVRKFVADDGVRVVFCTYHSTPILKKLAFDLAIFDEAHKTAGAEDKAFGFALHDHNVKIGRRLFLTATPRHVKMSLKQELEGEVAYSMSDKAVYGDRAYELSFRKAIEAKLICDYKIVLCVALEDHDIKANNYSAAQVALDKAMTKYNVKRAITFHSTIAKAKQFASDHKGALHRYAKWHINGGMSADDRKERIDGMIKEGGITTNVRCLSEGVDFPAVDSVAFVDPKRSRIDIVQSVGRCMRIDPNDKNKLATVLVPVYIKRDESEEAAVARSKFGHVYDVLNALKQSDDALAGELRLVSKGGEGCGDEDGGCKQPPPPSLPGPIIDIVGDDLPTLRRAIEVRLSTAFHKDSEHSKKLIIDFFEANGRFPSSVSKDENERRLAIRQSSYCSPGNKCYDEEHDEWSRKHGYGNAKAISVAINIKLLQKFYEKYGHFPKAKSKDKNEIKLAGIQASYCNGNYQEDHAKWSIERGYGDKAFTSKKLIKEFYEKYGYLPRKRSKDENEVVLAQRLQSICGRGKIYNPDFVEWSRQHGYGSRVFAITTQHKSLVEEFYEKHGRFPSQSSKDKTERKLSYINQGWRRKHGHIKKEVLK